MKPQIFSMRNAPVGIIGFLLLMTTTQIGCAVVLFNINRVLKLDPVLLTQNDLHTIALTKRNRIGIHPDLSKHPLSHTTHPFLLDLPTKH